MGQLEKPLRGSRLGARTKVSVFEQELRNQCGWSGVLPLLKKPSL
jgi:hypothetical protein